MKCRHCNNEVTHAFLDLGSSPPSNAYLTEKTLFKPEKWFPLKVMVCDNCWLVQTEDFTDAHELFDADYAYFSSFSSSWLSHAQKYVETMVDRFGLNQTSHVIEIAANDGYLLQYVKAKNIPCLGIEPTHSTAEAAREKGIEIVEEFFGVALAERLVSQGYQADLTAANNVLAHVPDINDFAKGFSILLKENGVATFEFPHLLNLVQKNQFDTIYHEHFSYLSLTSVKSIFEKNGLQIFDVEEIPTHGGSLRIFAQRQNTGTHKISDRLITLIEKENSEGVGNLNFYQDYQSKVEKIKNDLVGFLIEAKKSGKKVVAYGAAAKGNTLLNYAGIRSDLISFVVDKNPAKQNKFMPGSRIPILAEINLKQTQPDYVVILPWNLKDEVTDQLSYIKAWGGRFVTAIPSLEVSS
ncbi:class I SAM-dependent methyltransferase [Methylophilus sp. Q8]|uniref:class I SAM-dependent methyltransferase n=1 Tax=Methylophilus sp. Q8 TaxID=1506586 RepID=UPI00064575DB|nr:class I SAM-dependent methyltransferase [Methylophilus sp. Q8]